MNNKKRGKYLVELRNRKNLKQTDLAELIHYTDKNISKWENGKSFPNDPNILNKLSEILDVPVINIIYGEDVSLELYNKLDNRKHIINKIVYSLFFIVILLSIFICIYMKYDNYYICSFSNNNINNSKISIIISDKYNRLKFNKLKSNKDIKLVIFYVLKDDSYYVLFESENDDLIITEHNDYFEYNFPYIIDNTCYLKVIYFDNDEDIFKLKFKKILGY